MHFCDATPMKTGKFSLCVNVISINIIRPLRNYIRMIYSRRPIICFMKPSTAFNWASPLIKAFSTWSSI